MSSTSIPDQRNPALVLPSMFGRHTTKGARMMLDACRAIVAVDGWDSLKAIADAIDTRYAAIAAVPTSIDGSSPVLSNLTPQQGVKMSVITPQYDGVPEGVVTYQWVRGASTDIGGATSREYTPVLADVGETLKCRVIVTNSGGNLTVTSAASAAVIAA